MRRADLVASRRDASGQSTYFGSYATPARFNSPMNSSRKLRRHLMHALIRNLPLHTVARRCAYGKHTITSLASLRDAAGTCAVYRRWRCAYLRLMSATASRSFLLTGGRAALEPWAIMLRPLRGIGVFTRFGWACQLQSNRASFLLVFLSLPLRLRAFA
jgi:hypothetical protein